MKDIVDLNVRQIRIYPADVVPFQALALERNQKPFKENLRFKGATLGDQKAEVPTFSFLNGEIEHDDTVHLVEHLQIEPTRMLLSVFGSSAVADTLYEKVYKILVDAAPEGPFAKAKPYVKVEETGCIVTLDVDFRKLFSPEMLRFLEKTVRPRTSTKTVASKVVPFRFSGQISYEVLDDKLKKTGVRIMDKPLTIEPRIQTRLEERRYFTQSPTDSDTHFALLREFEKAFKGSTK